MLDVIDFVNNKGVVINLGIVRVESRGHTTFNFPSYAYYFDSLSS